MASSFARQLQSIALNSSHELDLKARRGAHAESLIFPKEVAIKQDWDTLYQICVQGYYELCQLDKQFKAFERNLFSEQSKEQDRDQLNKSQNEALDVVIEQCLALLAPRLVLRPGVRCLEWLVRRFRIHVHNITPLLCTLLSYHELPIFVNVLSIIPEERLVDTWKWLRPYRQVNDQVPRHAVVYAMTNNNAFFDAINAYVLQAAQNGAGDKTVVKFWAGLIVEAVSARLGQAKSGRKEVQRQRTEDILLKVLPILNDGLVLDDCPDMVVACFTISLVMAGTGLLQDVVLDKLMEAISHTLRFPAISSKQVLVTLSILAAQNEPDILPSRVLKHLMSTHDLLPQIKELGSQYPVKRLLYGALRSALKGLKNKVNEKKLQFIHDTLQAGPDIVERDEIAHWIMLVVSELHSLNSEHPQEGIIRNHLIKILQQLHATGAFSAAFAEAANLGLQQNIYLSDLLQTSLDIDEPAAHADADEMDVDVSTRELEGKRRISDEASAVESFLVSDLPPVFSPLTDILQNCINADTVPDFQLSKKKYLRSHEPAYPSFLVRVACGNRSVKLTAAATGLLCSYVQSKTLKSNCQVLLPYAIILLADSSPDVRREAVGLVKAMAEASSKDGIAEMMIEIYPQLQAPSPSIVNAVDMTRIMEQILVPMLAECELDARQIGYILRHALNGSPADSASTVKHTVIELKKNQRISLFQTLIDATLTSPILSFQIGMVKLLEGVHKVGPKNRLEALKKLLTDWMSQTQSDANSAALSEDLELADVDNTMASLMSAQDKQSVTGMLNDAINSNLEIRPAFITALFERVQRIYKDMTDEVQANVTKTLFELSFSSKSDFAKGARSTLQQLPLSTPILKSFISESVASTPSEIDGPTPKRRRTSHGRAPPSQLAEALGSAVPRLSLTLELVEGSKPGSKPEILPNLFDIMLVFRKLKGQSQPVSPYLLNLCLSNINTILEKQRVMRRPLLDLTVVRADIVTDFVRTTESPQVQATALQLLASLAALAPERVIHNMMPVFTFMGNDILSKDDEHSVNVVNAAIDYIIPPLVESLKNQDEGSLIRSAGGLLTNFVLAYNHIPSHRRVGLYQRLLRRLGREDFAFAMVSMLVVQRIEDEDLPSFFGDVLKDFGAVERLVTYRSLMSLVKDIFLPKPVLAQQLTQVSETSSTDERQAMALMLFETAADLLNSKHLRLQIKKTEKAGADEATLLHEEFRACLHQILESLRDSKTHGADVFSATQQCLSNLLELLPLTQLIESLPGLLREMDHGDNELKAVALRVLANQLQSKAPKDSKTAEAAIRFLPELRQIVEGSNDVLLTHAAVQCIDRIVETYGRKDIDSVIEITGFLVGHDINMGEQEPALLVCLASILDIVKEAAVPITTPMLEKVSRVLDGLSNGQGSEDTYNATCSVVSAVITHVSYMITDSQLLQIMSSLLDKGDLMNSRATREMRKDTLDLLARKADVATLIPCLQHLWQKAAKEHSEQCNALLDVFATLIQQHSRSAITRSADIISAFILDVFDTPAIQQDYANNADDSFAEQSASSILNGIVLKFIYKLNDKTFRPIFVNWVEWADSEPRQIAAYRFLHHFFDTLKSVVTNFAAYIINPANTILTTFATKKHSDLTETDKHLYRALLALLTSIFEHDADAFFATPSNFSPLSTNILSQLNLAAHKPLRPMVFSSIIPSIVALATAVQDTPSHHHTINHALSLLRQHESSHVRLASIETHIALTEDEEVGDEWINNVVSGTNNGDVGRDGGGSGETMIYVNEMLEDDDEEVERKVRFWVRMVRDRVGEDVFEF